MFYSLRQRRSTLVLAGTSIPYDPCYLSEVKLDVNLVLTLYGSRPVHFSGSLVRIPDERVENIFNVDEISHKTGIIAREAMKRKAKRLWRNRKKQVLRTVL